MNLRVTAARPAIAPVRPKPAAQAAASRPVSPALPVRATAGGKFGLPELETHEAYKTYAILAVGYARSAEDRYTQAKAKLVSGQGTQADVDDAASELNAARAEIRKLKRTVGFFEGLIWKLFKGFNHKAFWEEQKVDTGWLTVTPRAPEFVKQLKGPVADAVNAAVEAVAKNNWAGAEASFTQAVKLAGTRSEAIIVGQTAAKLRFHLSADNAYAKATELALTTDDALEVAKAAMNVTTYKYQSGDLALRKAADLAKTKADALKVGNLASENGYNDAATYAYYKAQALS